MPLSRGNTGRTTSLLKLKPHVSPGDPKRKCLSFFFGLRERIEGLFSFISLIFLFFSWKSLVTFTQLGGLQGIFSAFDFDNDESSSDFKAPLRFKFPFGLFHSE